VPDCSGRCHGSAVNGHEWIHKQLDLTSGEQKALEPIETKFAERKRNLMGAIRSANKELAEAIKQDQANSPRVSAAVERIHLFDGFANQHRQKH
jgi:Spy/CpxP family protein refolding chaperone